MNTYGQSSSLTSQELSTLESGNASTLNGESSEVQKICFPFGSLDPEANKILEIVGHRRRIRRGSSLYLEGEEFKALFTVRSGFFKTVASSEYGHAQVMGFQMSAEIMGFDGIYKNCYTNAAIALEDADVCVLPFVRLEEVGDEIPTFKRQLFKLMSYEIIREHRVMMMLGGMRAEARLAAFLIDLASRMHQRGYSRSNLVLRMTREEIGSCLGLKLETVSRIFSKFVRAGVISVKQRSVIILSHQDLEQIFTQRFAI